MKNLLLIVAHLLTTLAKLLGPGGAKAIVADSLLMKQQLLIINRSRRRAPNLTATDRLLLGFWPLFLNPHGIRRAAVILKPSTLLKFHDMLKRQKYRLLYPAGRKRKPGPGSSQGPSWLTLIGHLKHSLWSIDMFRCESILLRSHWVLVVMDRFTRRIIGLGVHAGDVDGVALCRIFNKAISTMGAPTYLSSDNDPLFQCHQWQANLSITDELKSVPYTPRSHPFVERLIGTLRREYLDHTLFWNAVDLERKLELCKNYHNRSRTHASLDGNTPAEISGDRVTQPVPLHGYARQKYCGGLFQLPVAA